MIDDLPNLLIVPNNHESPSDIIEDYVEMILAIGGDEQTLTYLLQDMFDDVNYWSVKQMLIDQAKLALGHLEQLEEVEHEFIEDDIDED